MNLAMNLTWQNLLAWSLQVALITLAGALLPRVFSLKIARSRLWYWRGLLLLCLALPLLQPWAHPAPEVSAVTFSTGPLRAAAEQASRAPSITLPVALAILLAAGIFLRLLWLAAGILKLRRYYRQATTLRPAVIPGVDILVSPEVTSPVTFGLRDPVILVPRKFTELPPEAQQSILCHELIHIERHDWPVAIAEEILRSFLWFHPAIWWILGQVQLAREQVVDQTVIERTGDSERYLDALLTIASFRLTADLAPAPLFLKKRHLRQRVESLVSGVPMTKRNLLLPLAAAFATLPLVIGVAAWQFPLRAAPQDAVDDPGVAVEMGQAKILHRTPVVYPEQARTNHISGTVVVSVSLDEKGEVLEAIAESGPEQLRKAVVQSVLNWHFSMEGGQARKFPLAISFIPGGDAPAPAAENRAAESGMPDTARTVDSFSTLRLPSALKEKVQQANLVHTGDVLTRENLHALEASLRAIDDHLRLSAAVRDDKLMLSVMLVGPQMPRAASASAQSLRVGGNVQSANLITHVAPKYPALAKQAGLQGLVRFNAIIARDGTIENLQAVSGHPMLIQAATDAVKQWVYKPTLFNGNPVEVITTIDINFTLTK